VQLDPGPLLRLRAFGIFTALLDAVNAITLSGSLLDQLIFGLLANRFGRRKLYGLELMVVIFGALGLCPSSAGYHKSSMSILRWILFWRFFVALGIGAGRRLSAVITAEFVPCLPS
jgi:PHS family inorganic phosphate transporter-like MFS transporter